MKIILKRLILRSLEIPDVSDRYVEWLNDPLVNQYLETRHNKQTRSSCIEFLTKCNDSPSEHLFGIFAKNGSLHIGNAKIGFIHPVHETAQIILFIGDKDYWGRGLGTEIISGLTEFGFGSLSLKKIEAGCYEENLASLKAFLRCGYAVEGFSTNAVVRGDRRTGVFKLGKSKPTP